MKSKILFFIFLIFLVSCAKSSIVKDTNKPTTKTKNKYIVTNTYAIHLLFGVFPIYGDASFDKTLNESLKEANKNGKSNIRFFHKDTSRLWFIFPPISFIITPVNTELIGEIED